MSCNPCKFLICALLMIVASQSNTTKSFAESDASSNGEVTDRHSQETLDKIHQMEAKMEENRQRLETLENSINQADVKMAPEASSRVTAPPAEVVSVKANAAPVEVPAPVVETVPVEPVTAVPHVQEAVQTAPVKDEIVQAQPVQAEPVQMASNDSSTYERVPFQSEIKSIGNVSKDPSYTTTEESDDSNYQYKIAPEVSYITYKESSLNVKEKGPFYGIYGSYDYHSKDEAWKKFVVHMDGHFNFGLIKYTEPGVGANNVRDYLLEPRLWLGRDLPLLFSTRVTPYGGIGYRFLFDHLGADHGIGGYDRRSQYVYAPVGFEINTKAIQGWEFGLDAEYDIFIHGLQSSYLSNVDSRYPDLNNSQSGGFGLRGSLDIVKKMDKVNIFLSPYFRYWHIKQSKTVQATKVTGNQFVSIVGYEPDNKSTEVGIRMGVEF